MTDNDLRAQLAAMQASLRHIEGSQGDMKTDLRALSSSMSDFLARLVVVETGGKALSNLPETVAENKLRSAIQEAVREERAHTNENLKKTLTVGFGATGTLFAVMSFFINWFLGGVT